MKKKNVEKKRRGRGKEWGRRKRGEEIYLGGDAPNYISITNPYLVIIRYIDHA